MTDAACCERITTLQRQLAEVLAETDCSWVEVVGAVGFTLAVLIDMKDDDALRVGMAVRVADKLLAGAWVRGSFGIPERMQ
jgi:hypothetical protein